MVSLADIQNAARIIQGKVLRTPLVYSPAFSEMTGSEIYLKLENLQTGGCFKVRGATSKVQSHLAEIGSKGVIAASVGNHAQGVALAARAANLPATIIMPVWASMAKQEATRNYGAEVILKGISLVESIEIAQDMAARSGRTFIHPYDDPDIIAGQGTIALEILEDAPDLDAIIVPVGGGGLIAGIAIAAKAISPKIRIIGVQARACPSAVEAIRQGHPVAVEEESSIADAIMVTQVGDSDFPVLRDYVDEIVLVDEDQIAAAVLMLLERKRILAEGAGAVPLAALLSPTHHLAKKSKVALVISGGNVDSLLLDRILHKGLLMHGRLMRLHVDLKDSPDSLDRLLDLISRMQAGIVHIRHFHNERDLPVGCSRAELELETRGIDHIAKIANALNDAGYHIDLK